MIRPGHVTMLVVSADLVVRRRWIASPSLLGLLELIRRHAAESAIGGDCVSAFRLRSAHRRLALALGAQPFIDEGSGWLQPESQIAG